jgi:hypothetical protein
MNFPKCDSYVGTHDDGTSLGRLSNHVHRIKKKKTHEAFDALWRNGDLSRDIAYEKLADYLGLHRELCHIGYMSIDTLEKAYQWSGEMILKLNKKK